MKFLFYIVLAVTFAIAGEEKVISLGEVPSELFKKAKKILPNVEFISANIEQEENYLVYEIQGIFPDNRKVEVDILSHAKVEEIEIEYPSYMVPKAVFLQIEKKYNGFKPTYIEASHSESMKVVKYEFEGIYNNNKIDIEVSADGRKIVEADK